MLLRCKAKSMHTPLWLKLSPKQAVGWLVHVVVRFASLCA